MRHPKTLGCLISIEAFIVFSLHVGQVPHCVIKHAVNIDGEALVFLTYKGALASNEFDA